VDSHVPFNRTDLDRQQSCDTWTQSIVMLVESANTCMTRQMHVWLVFPLSLYVNSPPTPSFHGSSFRMQSCSFVLVIALVSAVTIHFQQFPPQLESDHDHTNAWPITKSRGCHTYIQWSSFPPPLESPQVCCVTPSHLDNSPISAWLATNPVLSLWTSMAVAKPGGSANAQTWREEKGIWWK